MCGGGGGGGGTISAEGGQYLLADYVRGGQFPLADYVRGDKICGGTESAPTPALIVKHYIVHANAKYRTISSFHIIQTLFPCLLHQYCLQHQRSHIIYNCFIAFNLQIDVYAFKNMNFIIQVATRHFYTDHICYYLNFLYKICTQPWIINIV